MENQLKSIAFFGCSFTSRYRQGLCKCFNNIAQELGINIVFFNSLGKIGEINSEYGDFEFDLIDYIDLSRYDGIIFDGEGYNVEGMADKVIAKLRTANCPVVSISSHVDGFYNIDFDDTAGLRLIIEHFLDHHGFTKIGFMSGYLTHPDAQARLKEFRTIMKERGLPEDGAGMFEGDFWFHKGKEAADFFLSLPERPQAVVCANDYMAIALAMAFKEKGFAVPDDIAVSGFDGTLEGQQFLPHITSATRERQDIAERALHLLLDLSNGKKCEKVTRIVPKPMYMQSCGCKKVNYEDEALNVNEIYEINRLFCYNLNDAESSLLKLNKVDSLATLEYIFKEFAINFGEYSAFTLMLQIDGDGRLSCDSNYSTPSKHFVPVIWADKKNRYIRPEKIKGCVPLTPIKEPTHPHFTYIMSVHCAERMFGYAIIEMANNDIFNEFYNIWLLFIAITLERLLQNDRITSLIRSLENISVRDGLTGMLNRRGFEERSHEAIKAIKSARDVCTMVIDMDGLKHINDVYGHQEGDSAIKAAADIISQSCTSGEIAGRAGGDEFYIFAPDYSESRLTDFIQRLNELSESFNRTSGRPYKVELSYGSYMTKSDSSGRLDDFIKISDMRMYEMKSSKPNRRK